jgi:short-subunit dehydrogenase
VYGATKAALDTYLESLRNRLAVRGVTITTVKPGYVRTDLLEGLQLPAFFPVVSPQQAAQEILAGAAAGKRTVYVPPWWRFVMMAIRAVPSPLMQRLNF